MSNILENAKFGDLFKTRNNKKAMYLGEINYYGSHHSVLIWDDPIPHNFEIDGTSKNDSELHELDIISKWNELFDDNTLE